MTKIILLNGPPRCGKDYAGNLLTGPGARVAKFAHVLKERTHAAYSILHRGQPAPHDWFETTKDEPCGEFLGRTPREAYIAFSEQFMKPLHGVDIFGRLLLAELAKHARSWLSRRGDGRTGVAALLGWVAASTSQLGWVGLVPPPPPPALAFSGAPPSCGGLASWHP